MHQEWMADALGPSLPAHSNPLPGGATLLEKKAWSGVIQEAAERGKVRWGASQSVTPVAATLISSQR